MVATLLRARVAPLLLVVAWLAAGCGPDASVEPRGPASAAEDQAAGPLEEQPLSNARFFELASGYLEATPAAHALLDLATETRNESRVLTRTQIRVTVVFTFGLAEYDAGHTATVEMKPSGELLAVTVSWDPAFDESSP